MKKHWNKKLHFGLFFMQKGIEKPLSNNPTSKKIWPEYSIQLKLTINLATRLLDRDKVEEVGETHTKQRKSRKRTLPKEI